MGEIRRSMILGGCCGGTPRPPLTREQASDYTSLFRALGDETRIQIVHLLAERAEPLCVCHIEAAFELSQATISHHLRVLRDAGLVTTERRGVWIYYHLNRLRLDALASQFASLARSASHGGNS